MSTPTTARGALLRRAGTLLVAAALVGAPATSAFADPTASPTVNPTAEASPTASASASASASPSPSATATSDATPTTSPSATTPSPTSPAPAPSASGSPTPPAATAGAPATTFLKGASPSLLAQAAGAAIPQTAYAADFIARTLAGGDDHYVYPGGFPDVGNTIDGVLALDAAEVGSTQADASFAWVEDNVADYMGNAFASTYAGPTAKAIIAAVAHGADPTAFGGVDLVTELQATEGAVEPGRFSDLPVDCGFDPCDYSTSISQSLAVIALVRAGESLSTDSVDFLLAQQCADGGFRTTMAGAECASDADATAFAAQALLAAGSAVAADEALDHLAAVQLGNGGLVSDDGIANTNTTAVAAQAFAAGGRDAELADARAFLVSFQYTCSSPTALRGGIAFSAEKRSTEAPSDEDLRATPQSALALSGQSLLSVEKSEGASAGTTPTPCTTTPAPTSTVDPTSTVGPPSSGAPTEGAGGSDPSVPVDSSATGSLAQTGTDLLAPALLGLLLVVVGGLAIGASSRRRGAHA